MAGSIMGCKHSDYDLLDPKMGVVIDRSMFRWYIKSVIYM